MDKVSMSATPRFGTVSIYRIRLDQATRSLTMKYRQSDYNVSFDFGVGLVSNTNCLEVKSNDFGALEKFLNNYIVCIFEPKDLPCDIFNSIQAEDSLEMFIMRWEDLLTKYGNNLTGRYVCYNPSIGIETIYQFHDLDFFHGLVNGILVRSFNADNRIYENIGKLILFDGGRPLKVVLKHCKEITVEDIASAVNEVLEYIILKDLIGIINTYITLIPEIVNIDSIDLVTSNEYPMKSYTSIS